MGFGPSPIGKVMMNLWVWFCKDKRYVIYMWWYPWTYPLWNDGSRSAIFCFMHLQRRSFRGSLTPLYSDFRVVGEICRDLFRFLQCSHDPGCSYPQPLIIWSKMPWVGAQPLKGSPALCHVKTCSGKMGKPFLCIPSFWFQCRPSATTQKAGFNLSTHYEIGDWASICHPFAFLDASPGLSMGHFGILYGYLCGFQVLPL